jgi:integrase/recombinase XerD
MNLSATLPSDQLDAVMAAVDLSMHGFDVKEQETSIIPASGIPEVVKYYIAARSISSLSIGTLKQYRYKLEHFFKTINKSFTDITSNDIRFYLHIFKQERNASDRYMESIRVTLNTFFQWLVDKEYLTKNPCTNVDKIKYQETQRPSLSSYELEYCRLKTVNVREKALVDFFFSTGLRVSECADVKLDDINWQKRSVRVRHGKGNKARTVYFNAESEVSLKQYLDTRSDSNNSLFISCRKPYSQLRSPGMEKIIRNIAKRSGIVLYPHKLRHTFATFGMHSGMPLEKLQLLLGHAKPETTLIYAQQDTTDVEHEYSRIYC